MSFDKNNFNGKKVIVTGAGRGIGRALCLKLANDLGAIVWAVSKNPDNLNSLKAECPTITPVSVDLEDWGATRSAIDSIGPVDYLVNNAGVLIIKSFLDTTAEDFDLCNNVNLRAVFNVSQVVGRNMIQAGISGSIVNMSSLSSIRPTEYACAYSISKAGLDQLTKIMAMSLGPHKIRVNSINPIGVDTEMLSSVVTLFGTEPSLQSAAVKIAQRVPMPGLVPMSNVVDTILFCLSDAASMMSGVILPLDGGFSATSGGIVTSWDHGCLAPGEKLIRCPYVLAHHILEARYARHLVKCRNNYLKEMKKLGKSPEYKICRYNYKHHLLQIEMENHEMLCPDAASVVDHLQKFPSSMSFMDELKSRSKLGEEEQDAETKIKSDSEVCDEDGEVKKRETGADGTANDGAMEEDSWDAEVDDNLKKGNVTYDPRIKLARNKGKIIQSLGGISTKSERKAFRQAQFEAFEARGGDFYDEHPERERNRWADPGAGQWREPERMTESEIRLKRARELAMAQKNATIVGGHLDPQNRKRRSDQAVEQINNIISLAQSEKQSQASDATSSINSTYSSWTLTL
ncbi:unnamed protein product [Allacma fusca]|uniref:CHHC U11-48K-type domain-containing protein n=1 Tax=Allacma fusca TaxID=39272 RepID=A0A8J2MFY9_9HEXA|nr:unnamed protein product [Allacma fusca]